MVKRRICHYPVLFMCEFVRLRQTLTSFIPRSERTGPDELVNKGIWKLIPGNTKMWNSSRGPMTPSIGTGERSYSNTVQLV